MRVIQVISKFFDYLKHLLVIVMDYGQFEESYSRINLRIQQLIYFVVGLWFGGLGDKLMPLVLFLLITELMNFVVWWTMQRDGSLQEKKKEKLEEVMP